MGSGVRRWRLPAMAVLCAILLGAGRPAVQAQGAPSLGTFIDVVRGYDVTTIRRTFPAYNQGLFQTLFGAGPGIPLASDEQRALFTEQLVTTPAGQALDIGHVITGLEAATALPPAARAAQAATGCAMTAAVTWSGDVGKALHDYLADPDAARRGPAFYFDREASPEDLLGDVDGWVLGIQAAGAPVDVAALLEDAYLSGDLESTRFHRFAGALGGTGGTALSDAARARAGDEIRCFARALATFTRSGVTGAAIEAEAGYFVERFIAFVEAGLT